MVRSEENAQKGSQNLYFQGNALKLQNAENLGFGS